jgi:hypothetical protein
VGKLIQFPTKIKEQPLSREERIERIKAALESLTIQMAERRHSEDKALRLRKALDAINQEIASRQGQLKYNTDTNKSKDNE